MKLEIKQWPESQQVMDNEEWFLIQSEPYDKLGSSCYARIIDEDDVSLKTIYTSGNVNEEDKEYITMVDQEDDGEI